MRRPERTVQVINELEADVVVLQEADKRLGQCHPAIPRAMIEEETDFELVEVCANDISLGWHGNAVLVRKRLAVLRCYKGSSCAMQVLSKGRLRG
jgi:endonuclease/exonuclease/phosphatase family metal-dependent hydrolase